MNKLQSDRKPAVRTSPKKPARASPTRQVKPVCKKPTTRKAVCKKQQIEPVWVPESLLGCKLTTHEGERITIPEQVGEPDSKYDWLLDVNTMTKEIRLIKGGSGGSGGSAGIKKYTELVHTFNYTSYFTQGELLKCDRGLYTVVQEKPNEWYLVSHGLVKKFIHNEQITGVKLDHNIPIATSKNWIIILSPVVCKVKQDLYSCYMNKDLISIEVACDITLRV